MPAVLVIKPHMGRLTRDTATGSMSPYIKVIVGTRQERTNVHADAGKYP